MIVLRVCISVPLNMTVLCFSQHTLEVLKPSAPCKKKNKIKKRITNHSLTYHDPLLDLLSNLLLDFHTFRLAFRPTQ